MEKGQGLSMNVIIIAALALLVLVVVSVIFMSRAGMFISDTKSCTQQGGVCKPVGDDCPTGMIGRTLGSAQCLDSSGKVRDGYKCCMPGE